MNPRIRLRVRARVNLFPAASRERSDAFETRGRELIDLSHGSDMIRRGGKCKCGVVHDRIRLLAEDTVVGVVRAQT